MSGRSPHGPDVQSAREMVEELLRAGLVIAGALESLLEDLPAGAFPGEDNAEVLLERVAGTCAPVIRAAGETVCRDTLGLVCALRDRFLADLRGAADAAAS
jgi:hypothetical protein